MTDHDTSSTVESQETTSTLGRARRWLQLALVFAGLVVLVEPAAAQSAGSAFCGTDMAQTIQNIFTLIQFGGPLVGGVLALGATVALPFVRRSDWKKEMKSIRNQGLLWGVIVAPLGTQIVAFLLNNVVAGGSSCGF
jgi:hypothetical protein